jgi:hypothetical protein
MDFQTAKDLIENQAAQLSIEQVLEINSFMITLKEVTQDALTENLGEQIQTLKRFISELNQYQPQDEKMLDSLSNLHIYSHIVRLQKLFRLWSGQEPTENKIDELKQSYKNLLIQQIFRFSENNRKIILGIIQSQFTHEELTEHEAVWVSLFEQLKDHKNAHYLYPLISFIYICDKEDSTELVFKHYFEMVDKEERLHFFKNYSNSKKIPKFFLKKIELSPQKSLIEEYLDFFYSHKIQFPLFEFLTNWLKNTDPNLLTPNNLEVPELYASNAPASELIKLNSLWQNWIQDSDLKKFKTAMTALYNSEQIENQDILANILLVRNTKKDKQQLLLAKLKAKENNPFEYRYILLTAIQSEVNHIQDWASQRLVNLKYSKYNWYYSSTNQPNDPDFWYKLWQESPTRALQLNGACQLYLCDPENSDVTIWLVQQMDSLPLKSLRKIWKTFQMSAPEAMQRELALKQMTSPRQLLRELAISQLRKFKLTDLEWAHLIAALQDPALPVQIAAAKALASQAPEINDTLKDWLLLQLESDQNFAIAEALILIRKLNLKDLDFAVQALNRSASKRLQKQSLKTLASLKN